MIKCDACLWGWEGDRQGRRRETHGLWQMWFQQDVLGWVIPSLWLLAFFWLLVSLQLNDGYLFQVANPLTVWNPTLGHVENTHTQMGTHTHTSAHARTQTHTNSLFRSVSVHEHWVFFSFTPHTLLFVTLPSGSLLSWQKKVLSQTELLGKLFFI